MDGTNEAESPDASVDVSRAPLGVRAAAALVAAVAAGDDRLERHYLEVKSDLDLTKKNDLAKIAKFILGAANRLPSTAASAFEGYGVMVVGVAPGEIKGVPPIEMLEIDKVVNQYLGASGPRWDLLRVPVPGSINEVLVVLVDPPQDGQDPYPCRKGGDNLIDGRIYVRADGETREAKSDELDRLLERGKFQSAPDVAFDVEIDGVAHPVGVNGDRSLETYIKSNRARLLDALPKPVSPDPQSSLSETGKSGASVLGGNRSSMVFDLGRFSGSVLGSDPEKRTELEYRTSVDGWEAEYRERWHDAIDTLSSYRFDGVAIRVRNGSKTFFHDVQVKIHLEGDVRGIGWRNGVDGIRRSDLGLPSSPRIWGPTPRQPFDPSRLVGQSYFPAIPSTYRSPLDWRNSGSVDLTLEVGALRPRETYIFDDDELVLVLPLEQTEKVHGTWEITARDHNEVFSGEIMLDVGEPNDLTTTTRRLIGLD